MTDHFFLLLPAGKQKIPPSEPMNDGVVTIGKRSSCKTRALINPSFTENCGGGVDPTPADTGEKKNI